MSTSTDTDWQQVARTRWPYALFVAGNGPFAVGSFCNRRPWFQLFSTRNAADYFFNVELSRDGCSDDCRQKHKVSNLRTWLADQEADRLRRKQGCSPLPYRTDPAAGGIR
jgi:hypothetical protein